MSNRDNDKISIQTGVGNSRIDIKGWGVNQAFNANGIPFDDKGRPLKK